MEYRDYVLIFAPSGMHSLQAMVLLNQTPESFAAHSKDFPGEPHNLYWGPPLSEPADPTFLPGVVLFGGGINGYYFLESMSDLPALLSKLDLVRTSQVNHTQTAEVFAVSTGIPTTVYPAGRDGPPLELKGEALLLLAHAERNGGRHGCDGDCGDCDGDHECDNQGGCHKKGMH